MSSSSWTGSGGHPVRSGVLSGALREELLDCGDIQERLLFPDDLARSDAVHRIDVVTGWTKLLVSDLTGLPSGEAAEHEPAAAQADRQH